MNSNQLYLFALMTVLLTPFQIMAQGNGVYQAPDPEPTPEEVLIVEYINRFRADPKADAGRIYPTLKKHAKGFMFKTDPEMFKREVEKMPGRDPLVINLKLLDSARKHAHYQIINRVQSHDQIPGKPGFTGRDLAERQKAAGYKRHMGENCFVYAHSPWHAHMAFIVDWGQGPGGMLKGRGHRMLIGDRRPKEVAVGILRQRNGNLAVVQHFGLGDRRRYVGGVVFKDKNGNGFYDVGEGMGGVSIKASDGSQMKTWKSGGFGMPLKRSSSVTLTASHEGKTYTKKFKSGRGNIKFDWVVGAENEAKSKE